MIKKNKKINAFTMVELLVVILIIGTLFSLALLSLGNARRSARDAKRVADVKQIQFALEIYYRDNGQYPSDISESIVYNDLIYLSKTPSAPIPSDGSCSDEDNFYSYSTNYPENNSYSLVFCIGGTTSDLGSGKKMATSNGIFDLSFSLSGSVKYYNENLTPMKNVTIYLKQNGATKYSATTSSSGDMKYYFPFIIPGIYEVYFSLPTAGGHVNSADALRLNEWLSSGGTNFGGLKVLAGDVYNNSSEIIITEDDSIGIANFFVTGGYPIGSYGGSYNPPGWFVFVREDNLTTPFSQFPITYANGGPDVAFSNMTIEVGSSNMEQDFYSLFYGDVDQSFIPE